MLGKQESYIPERNGCQRGGFVRPALQILRVDSFFQEPDSEKVDLFGVHGNQVLGPENWLVGKKKKICGRTCISKKMSLFRR